MRPPSEIDCGICGRKRVTLGGKLTLENGVYCMGKHVAHRDDGKPIDTRRLRYCTTCARRARATNALYNQAARLHGLYWALDI